MNIVKGIAVGVYVGIWVEAIINYVKVMKECKEEDED